MRGDQLSVNCGLQDVGIVKCRKVKKRIAESVRGKTCDFARTYLLGANQLIDERCSCGGRLRQQRLSFGFSDSAGLNECAGEAAER